MMQSIELENGVAVPIVGLGVFKAENGQETENAVKWALEAGYRHIDTAMFYQNEESVGNAIRSSNVPREEIFVTTKLWNEDIRQGRTEEAFYKSLEKLQLDYLDLYLIHWPAVGFEAAWTSIEKLYKEKKIRAIGVSNFEIHHFEELAKTMTIKPMVNQIEIHPYLTNNTVIDYCRTENIAVQGWSPISRADADLFAETVLTDLAKKYNKSVVQIILRWHIQRGIIVLPKSVKKERINTNIVIFDFELTNEEMAAITALNKDKRTGAHPDTFDF